MAQEPERRPVSLFASDCQKRKTRLILCNASSFLSSFSVLTSIYETSLGPLSLLAMVRRAVTETTASRDSIPQLARESNND